MYDTVTQDDVNQMRAEIDRLNFDEAPAIRTALNEARAQGDLSENAEYTAAKRNLRRLESRVRYLDNMIRTAKILQEPETAEDQVGITNKVSLFSEKTGRNMTIRIVTTVCANPLTGMISIESPIGKAIYLHKVNERLLVQMESGETFFVTILSVDKTPFLPPITISE
ncbi:MAG: transcription elongation factor GreA [Lachnospiraceae bacterium]|nr:transcription elongation factor GreA [Lachnospiraceae bacterium]